MEGGDHFVAFKGHVANGVVNAGCAADTAATRRRRNRRLHRWIIEKGRQSEMIEKASKVFRLFRGNLRGFDDRIEGILDGLHSQEIDDDLDELGIMIEKDIVVGVVLGLDGVVSGRVGVTVRSRKQFGKGGIAGWQAQCPPEDLEHLATCVDRDDVVGVIVGNLGSVENHGVIAYDLRFNLDVALEVDNN